MASEIIKIGSPLCPFCAYMSSFDTGVVSSKGYTLSQINSDEIGDYPRLMQLLLQKVKGELDLPTYVNLNTRNLLHGGFTEREFSVKIESILPQFSINGSQYLPLTLKRLELSVWELFTSKNYTVSLPVQPEDRFPEAIELKFLVCGEPEPETLLITSISTVLDEQGKFRLCRKKESG